MQNQPYQAGTPLSTGQHEFSSADNEMIEQTGARAKLWGIVSLITGAVALVGLVVVLLFKDELILHGLESSYVTVFVVSLVPIVLTHLVIAMLYVGAGKSLEAVAHTQGNDIEHLMQSLNKLGTAFLVEFVIGLVAIVGGAYIGVTMAADAVAQKKAQDAARAAAQAAVLEAAAEEEGEDEEGESDTDEDDAESEDDEEASDEDEGDSDTDGAAEDEASGGVADDPEGEDEDGEEGGEDAADEPAVEDEAQPAGEEPAAG